MITFKIDGLFDKGGFEDGDLLCNNEDWYYGMLEYGSHEFLFDVINELILPLLPIDIELEFITTIHNPVRAKTVDGVSVEVIGYETLRETFKDTTISLEREEIKEFAKRKFNEKSQI